MLTQIQRDAYTKMAQNPETLAIVAWSREDMRTMLREEGIDPIEENVDRLLEAREFPTENIQDKMIETGWEMLYETYDEPIETLKKNIVSDLGGKVAEAAARLRADGAYDEDAAAWLDMWMAVGGGDRANREQTVFDAMLEAYGLGNLPTTQWECLFSQAEEFNYQFEAVAKKTNHEVAYSRTATFDNIIQYAAMLLKTNEENGDPAGIHAAEPKLRFVTINIDGKHREWEFDTLEEVRDLWHSEECILPANDDPVTHATMDGKPVPLTDRTFIGLLKELGIDNG